MTATGAVDSFDYIVVGAGSAGCVLANRLTASGRHRALLLEAGGEDRNIWLHIPLGYGSHFTNPARQLALRDRTGAGLRQPAHHRSRAARFWAAQARSTG